MVPAYVSRLTWSPVTSPNCQYPHILVVCFMGKLLELGLSTLHKPLGAVVGTATYWHLQNLLRNQFNICLYGPAANHNAFHALINALSKRLACPVI